MSVPLIEEPCYTEVGSFCRWVYERSDENAQIANFADWFIDRPARVVLVLVLAYVVAKLARRAVRRLVERIVNSPLSTTAQLEKLGLEMPAGYSPRVRDPRRQARAASVSAVLTSTATVTVWTIALLTILGIIGVQLGPLVAGAGIAGVALGFGAQSLVKDCIAGLFMLIEDQYGIGDVVDLGEATGVVEEVTLRTTVLRGVNGTVWHVPNGVVQRVGNLSQLWSVALVDVDVAYDTEVDVARALLQQAGAEVCARPQFEGFVLEPPAVLGVESLGADGVTLRMTVKVDPGTQWDLQRALREHIKSLFDAADVEIPFAQRTVWLRTSRPDDVGTSGGGAGG